MQLYNIQYSKYNILSTSAYFCWCCPIHSWLHQPILIILSRRPCARSLSLAGCRSWWWLPCLNCGDMRVLARDLLLVQRQSYSLESGTHSFYTILWHTLHTNHHYWPTLTCDTWRFQHINGLNLCQAMVFTLNAFFSPYEKNYHRDPIFWPEPLKQPELTLEIGESCWPQAG